MNWRPEPQIVAPLIRLEFMRPANAIPWTGSLESQTSRAKWLPCEAPTIGERNPAPMLVREKLDGENGGARPWPASARTFSAEGAQCDGAPFRIVGDCRRASPLQGRLPDETPSTALRP